MHTSAPFSHNQHQHVYLGAKDTPLSIIPIVCSVAHKRNVQVAYDNADDGAYAYDSDGDNLHQQAISLNMAMRRSYHQAEPPLPESPVR